MSKTFNEEILYTDISDKMNKETKKQNKTKQKRNKNKQTKHKNKTKQKENNNNNNKQASKQQKPQACLFYGITISERTESI